MMGLHVDLEKLQEAQRWNERAIRNLTPGGAFSETIRMITIALHRYAVAITHVWHYKGGGLRASHRMELDFGRLRGRIFIDPGAVNPRGQIPSRYGPYEEARGGSHQFYGRTKQEEGPRVIGRVSSILYRSLT